MGRPTAFPHSSLSYQTFKPCPAPTLDHLAFSVGSTSFILLPFALLCVRQSHHLEVRCEALSLPGSTRLEGGAYWADVVEQVRVRQRLTLGQGRTWKNKLKIRVIYGFISSLKW